jgi:hypothetical protein
MPPNAFQHHAPACSKLGTSRQSHSESSVHLSLNQWIKHRLNESLRRRGFEIVPSARLYDWQHESVDQPAFNATLLPAGAADYLRPDNPKLLDLQKRYRAFDAQVTTSSVWTNRHVRQEYVTYFRGDNAWVWQVRGTNAHILAHALCLYYLKSIDRLGLLDKLGEDTNFGNFTFRIAGREVSRDLLDSVAEIYFLDRHLSIGSRPNLRILDIGAGYGRLAHRMLTAFPAIDSYLCTDVVAVSTFVCDYYLRFRGVEKACAVPLDVVDAALTEHQIDLAINIHSFSECRMEAIEWWVRLLAKHRVQYLMIVPNRTADGGERLLTNEGHDFLPILERYGYRTILKEPKYLDPVVQQYGPFPSWHHLLELRS